MYIQTFRVQGRPIIGNDLENIEESPLLENSGRINNIESPDRLPPNGRQELFLEHGKSIIQKILGMLPEQTTPRQTSINYFSLQVNLATLIHSVKHEAFNSGNGFLTQEEEARQIRIFFDSMFNNGINSSEDNISDLLILIRIICVLAAQPQQTYFGSVSNKLFSACCGQKLTEELKQLKTTIATTTHHNNNGLRLNRRMAMQTRNVVSEMLNILTHGTGLPDIVHPLTGLENKIIYPEDQELFNRLKETIREFPDMFQDNIYTLERPLEVVGEAENNQTGICILRLGQSLVCLNENSAIWLLAQNKNNTGSAKRIQLDRLAAIDPDTLLTFEALDQILQGKSTEGEEKK